MTIYSGFSQLENGGSFHSYVKLPEGNMFKSNFCPFDSRGSSVTIELDISCGLGTWGIYFEPLTLYQVDVVDLTLLYDDGSCVK